MIKTTNPTTKRNENGQINPDEGDFWDSWICRWFIPLPLLVILGIPMLALLQCSFMVFLFPMADDYPINSIIIVSLMVGQILFFVWIIIIVRKHSLIKRSINYDRKGIILNVSGTDSDRADPKDNERIEFESIGMIRMNNHRIEFVMLDGSIKNSFCGELTYTMRGIILSYHRFLYEHLNQNVPLKMPDQPLSQFDTKRDERQRVDKMADLVKVRNPRIHERFRIIVARWDTFGGLMKSMKWGKFSKYRHRSTTEENAGGICTILFIILLPLIFFFIAGVGYLGWKILIDGSSFSNVISDEEGKRSLIAVLCYPILCRLFNHFNDVATRGLKGIIPLIHNEIADVYWKV